MVMRKFLHTQFKDKMFFKMALVIALLLIQESFSIVFLRVIKSPSINYSLLSSTFEEEGEIKILYNE